MARRGDGDGLIVGGVVLAVVIYLAWIGLLAWGIIELVQWITSK
jgi:hypothetical protein